LRVLVVVVLLAAAGGVAYFFREGEGAGERMRERTPVPERGGVEPDPVGTKPLPEPESLPAFVAACRERGEEAVPLLLRRLRVDADRRLAPRWVFKDGKLAGYPTLRSAYISAIAAIPGESSTIALAQLLPDAKSAEEGYLIALALAERGRGGFAGEVLKRAAEGTAANQSLRMEMAEFAARNDPAATAAHAYEALPRGESREDGRILAAALAALPYEAALAASERALDDAEVTVRAKSALLRRLLRRRPEPEVFEAVEEHVRRGRLDAKLGIDAAYAAANSVMFVEDRNAHEAAVAKGDGDAADEVRRRFERRLRAARSLIETATGEGDGKRRAAMLKILDAHAKAFGE